MKTFKLKPTSEIICPECKHKFIIKNKNVKVIITFRGIEKGPVTCPNCSKNFCVGLCDDGTFRYLQPRKPLPY